MRLLQFNFFLTPRVVTQPAAELRPAIGERPLPEQAAPPEQPGRHARPVLDLAVVLALCLLAFGLRLYRLDASSLWLDEGFTVRRIGLSFGEILSNGLPFDGVITQDAHPPLYFLLLRLFSEVVGSGDFALRFYSVLWSVLLIPLCYVAGRALLSPGAGRAAALLATLSPVYLAYAQEVRMYTQLAFLSLVVMYLLARAGHYGGRRRWLALALATAALCYTHYTGYLVASYALLALLLLTLRTGRVRRLVALAVALLSTVPVLMAVIPRALYSGAEPMYSFVPLEVIATDLLNAFSLGLSVQFEDVAWLDIVFLGVLLVGLLFPPRQLRLHIWADGRWLLLGYLVVPIVVYYAISYVKPAYMGVRHLLVVSPAFYLLLAHGLWVLRERLRPLVALGLLVLLVGGMLYSTREHFLNGRYVKDEWRGLVRYIERNAWTRDAVIVNSTFVQPVLSQYNQGDGLPWISLPGMGVDARLGDQAQSVVAQLELLRASHPRLWFIPGGPTDGRDDNQVVETWLRQNTTRLDQVYFHGRTTVITVQLYRMTPVLGDPPPSSADEALVWQAGPQAAYWRLRRPPELTGGLMLPLEVQWYAPAPLAPADGYRVYVRLIDEHDLTWASTEEAIAAIPNSSRDWPVGKSVIASYDLALPPGLPPGAYRVQLTLLRVQDGVALAVPLRDEGAATDVELARVQIRPSFAMSDPRRPIVYQPVTVALASGLELRGYRIAADTVYPGQPVAVQLYWRALRDAPPDAMLQLELVDWLGRPLASASATVAGAGGSTAGWYAGQFVATNTAIRVPGALVPGSYRLQLRLAPGTERGPATLPFWPLARNTLSLGELPVGAWPRLDQLPAEATPTQARFGQQVSLAGYRIEGRAAPGQVLLVTLYWRADEALPLEAMDTVAYVHALDPAGQPLALHDSQPAGGERPVDSWRAGELIADRHVLSLPSAGADPAGADPSAYQLVVGLYGAASGQRWPVLVDGVVQPNGELVLKRLPREGPEGPEGP